MRMSSAARVHVCVSADEFTWDLDPDAEEEGAADELPPWANCAPWDHAAMVYDPPPPAAL